MQTHSITKKLLLAGILVLAAVAVYALIERGAFVKNSSVESVSNVRLDIDTNQYARSNMPLFLSEYAQPANYKGHFRIVGVGCGDDCWTLYALDKNTGKTYIVTSPDSNGGETVATYTIVEDEIQVGWLSGVDGVIKYNQKTDSFEYQKLKDNNGI
jgi:hypothetical protein